MPKVYYKARERMLVINGQEFPAEPIQAKRAMEAFGLELGEMLDLYKGSVYKDGAIIRINTAFASGLGAMKADGTQEQE